MMRKYVWVTAVFGVLSLAVSHSNGQTRPVLPNNVSGVPNSIGAYQPFAGPFYTPLPANPAVDAHSSEIIANMMKQLAAHQLNHISAAGPPYVGKTYNIDYNAPVYYSLETDPVYTITCDYHYVTPDVTCGKKIHIPTFANPEQSTKAPSVRTASDHLLAIIDSTTGTEYDMWRADVPSGNGGAFHVGFAGEYPANSGGFGITAASQSGFALTTGILRPTDLLPNADGAIPPIAHALRFTLPCANNYPGDVTSNEEYGASYPAILTQGSDQVCAGAGFQPYYGARIQFTMTPDQIKKLDVKPYVKTILTALYTYGAYLSDTGSGGQGTGVFDLVAESGLSYTQPPGGTANPWATLAAANGIAVASDGIPANQYLFPLDLGAAGIPDLGAYLRVIDPCVTAARLAPAAPAFGKCSY